MKTHFEVMPKALRKVRQDSGLRQIDISNRSGLSKAMVSAYESGKALPSFPSLAAYLEALGKDLSDLQAAIYEVSGVPSNIVATILRERAVGRAVLQALHGLELNALETDS